MPTLREQAAARRRRSEADAHESFVEGLLPLLKPCTLIGFALLYDAYFFLCHRAFHKSMKLYRRFHQLHHAVRDPMTFTAYYVTYQSHLVTEQLVFATASYLFVPRDVLLFYMYSALFETFAQHAGARDRPPRLTCSLAHLVTVAFRC